MARHIFVDKAVHSLSRATNVKTRTNFTFRIDT
jgi:hypothetical protein